MITKRDEKRNIKTEILLSAKLRLDIFNLKNLKFQDNNYSLKLILEQNHQKCHFSLKILNLVYFCCFI
jgi:hypothetical protein